MPVVNPQNVCKLMVAIATAIENSKNVDPDKFTCNNIIQKIDEYILALENLDSQKEYALDQMYFNLLFTHIVQVIVVDISDFLTVKKLYNQLEALCDKILILYKKSIDKFMLILPDGRVSPLATDVAVFNEIYNFKTEAHLKLNNTQLARDCLEQNQIAVMAVAKNARKALKLKKQTFKNKKASRNTKNQIQKTSDDKAKKRTDYDYLLTLVRFYSQKLNFLSASKTVKQNQKYRALLEKHALKYHKKTGAIPSQAIDAYIALAKDANTDNDYDLAIYYFERANFFRELQISMIRKQTGNRRLIVGYSAQNDSDLITEIEKLKRITTLLINQLKIKITTAKLTACEKTAEIYAGNFKKFAFVLDAKVDNHLLKLTFDSPTTCSYLLKRFKKQRVSVSSIQESSTITIDLTNVALQTLLYFTESNLNQMVEKITKPLAIVSPDLNQLQDQISDSTSHHSSLEDKEAQRMRHLKNVEEREKAKLEKTKKSIAKDEASKSIEQTTEKVASLNIDKGKEPMEDDNYQDPNEFTATSSSSSMFSSSSSSSSSSSYNQSHTMKNEPSKSLTRSSSIIKSKGKQIIDNHPELASKKLNRVHSGKDTLTYTYYDDDFLALFGRNNIGKKKTVNVIEKGVNIGRRTKNFQGLVFFKLNKNGKPLDKIAEKYGNDYVMKSKILGSDGNGDLRGLAKRVATGTVTEIVNGKKVTRPYQVLKFDKLGGHSF